MAAQKITADDWHPPKVDTPKYEALPPTEELLRQVLQLHRDQIDANGDGNAFAEWHDWKQTREGKDAIAQVAQGDDALADSLLSQSNREDRQSLVEISQTAIEGNQQRLESSGKFIESVRLEAENRLDELASSGLEGADYREARDRLRAELKDARQGLDAWQAASRTQTEAMGDFEQARGNDDLEATAHAVSKSWDSIQQAKAALAQATHQASPAQPDDEQSAQQVDEPRQPDAAEEQGNQADEGRGHLNLKNDALARWETGILDAAAASGVDPVIIAAQVWAESRGKQNTDGGGTFFTENPGDGTRDLGLMQIGKERWQGYANDLNESERQSIRDITGRNAEELDMNDPAHNLIGGAFELKYWLEQAGGDLRRALNGYVSGDVNYAEGIGDRGYADNVMKYMALIEQGKALPDSD